MEIVKQVFSFDGVAKRQEYWAVQIAAFVYILAALIIVGNPFLTDLTALLVLFGFIATIWALLATTTRRLRDAGISLWWMLVYLIPYVSTVAAIVFGCIKTKETE